MKKKKKICKGRFYKHRPSGYGDCCNMCGYGEDGCKRCGEDCDAEGNNL